MKFAQNIYLDRVNQRFHFIRFEKGHLSSALFVTDQGRSLTFPCVTEQKNGAHNLVVDTGAKL